MEFLKGFVQGFTGIFTWIFNWVSSLVSSLFGGAKQQTQTQSQASSAPQPPQAVSPDLPAPERRQTPKKEEPAPPKAEVSLKSWQRWQGVVINEGGKEKFFVTPVNRDTQAYETADGAKPERVFGAPGGNTIALYTPRQAGIEKGSLNYEDHAPLVLESRARLGQSVAGGAHFFWRTVNVEGQYYLTPVTVRNGQLNYAQAEGPAPARTISERGRIVHLYTPDQVEAPHDHLNINEARRIIPDGRNRTQTGNNSLRSYAYAHFPVHPAETAFLNGERMPSGIAAHTLAQLRAWRPNYQLQAQQAMNRLTSGKEAADDRWNTFRAQEQAKPEKFVFKRPETLSAPVEAKNAPVQNTPAGKKPLWGLSEIKFPMN